MATGLPPDLLPVSRASVLVRSVAGWYASIRDRCLATLTVFVSYVRRENFSWPRDGRFTDAALIGFMDFLLCR